MTDVRTTGWLLLAGAFAVRLAGMWHDVWFDEAWSFVLVWRYLESPADVLTRLHIDNNHPLVSWLMYGLGGQYADWVYRVPSLVLGTASVALAGRILRERGAPHALAAMLFVGGSYPLVVYASEARGYAPMIFFLLLATRACQRFQCAGAWRDVLTFWAAVVLGTLSHLTFLQGYLALLAWSVLHAYRQGGPALRGARAIPRLHGVPLVFIAGLYLVFIRHLQVAGAEPAAPSDVLAQTLTAILGTPESAGWLWLGVPLFVGLLLLGLRQTRATVPSLATLFVTGIVVVPLLVVTLQVVTSPVPPRFFPRYFLPAITLFLLLLASLVGDLLQRRGAARVAGVAICGLYLLGHGWQIATFTLTGRGQYRAALTYMAEHSETSDIRLASNSDLRTGVLLAFHRRHLPPDRTVTYYPAGSGRTHEAQWRIVETVEGDAPRVDTLRDADGQRFTLVGHFPFRGLSGAHWTLYRRVGADDAR